MVKKGRLKEDHREREADIVYLFTYYIKMDKPSWKYSPKGEGKLKMRRGGHKQYM